jgi:hypothetical protein
VIKCRVSEREGYFYVMTTEELQRVNKGTLTFSKRTLRQSGHSIDRHCDTHRHLCSISQRFVAGCYLIEIRTGLLNRPILLTIAVETRLTSLFVGSFVCLLIYYLGDRFLVLVG